MPTTVSGSIKSLLTSAIGSSSNAFVRFWLRGTRGNQPVVVGAGTIAPLQSQNNIFYCDLAADGSGNVSGTIYSTRDATGLLAGDITLLGVNGSGTAVNYGMQVFNNGVAGPEVAVHAKNGVTLDPSSVTPLSTLPVVTSPTGDNTYLRLDAGNSPVSGLATFSTGLNTKKLDGVRLADQYTTVANVLADAGSNPCPFIVTPLFTDATLFSPLAANAYLIDVRRPTGKYGPIFIVGDLPPSNNNPSGYPGVGSFDTGIDLNYTLQASARQYDLTGTTINANNAIWLDFASLAGNPTAGSGDRQIVGKYQGIETSSTAGHLANVAEIKLRNSYFSLRAPSFTGNMAGNEDDVFYRAAGTISKIDYAHLSVAGVPDAIAANITGTSYVEPVELDIKGSGSHGNWVMKDLRPVISMAPGGTLSGLTGFGFGLVQTVTTQGTVTENIYGFQAQGPATLPTFSAGKKWYAMIVNPGAATGADVNNVYFAGGDWNSGHLVLGNTHLWESGSDGLFHYKSSAPANSTDGNTLADTSTAQTLTNKSLTNPVITGANGSAMTIGSASEEVTLSTSGATTDSVANLLPANSIIEAVVARVTVTITTATDWKLGDSAQPARFSNANSTMTAGTTQVGLNHADPTVASANLGPVQVSAAPVRITTTGTPGAGKIRITVFYRQFTAPTS